MFCLQMSAVAKFPRSLTGTTCQSNPAGLVLSVLIEPLSSIYVPETYVEMPKPLLQLIDTASNVTGAWSEKR